MIKKLQIALVEDNDSEAEKIEKYIAEFCLSHEYQTNTVRFKDGYSFIKNYIPEYDLIFMDVKMPMMDGIEASRKLRKVDNEVALILVTNMMQYAVKGYEVGALDFMLKPVTCYEFELKFLKALSYIQKNRNRKFTIETGKISKVLSISEIMFIEVLNHKLIYHTESGVFETYGQLKDVEKVLEPHFFRRSSNSYLINLRHVWEIHPDSLVVGSEKVPLSRRKKKEFMEDLSSYIGGSV